MRLRDRKRGKSDPDRRNKTLRMIDARYENVQQAIFLNSLLEVEIFELIEEWSASRNRPISTREKFALLENLYRQFSADQRIDLKAVARTLKLVGGIG